MAFTRKTVRQNLAALLKAATLPGSSTLALEAVFEGVPDEVIDEDLPACIIRLGATRETRLTAPVGAGVKLLTVPITLDIFDWEQASDDLLGERYLDDILDGIDAALRGSTISGSVAISYEDVETTVHPPVVSMQGTDPAGMVLLHATRQIRALAFDGG